jgi:hypothetical protein
MGRNSELVSLHGMRETANQFQSNTRGSTKKTERPRGEVKSLSTHYGRWWLLLTNTGICGNEDDKAAYFAAFFCFAHRLRCAAEIFSRASALIVRFLRAGLTTRPCPVSWPASMLRASWRREISESIWESSSVTFMAPVYSTPVIFVTSSLNLFLRTSNTGPSIEEAGNR